MTNEDIAELHELDSAASAAPWHVVFGNDGAGMSATFVTKNPSVGRVFGPGDEWSSEDVIAACLMQSPPIAESDDRCWDDNARLIAAVRNCLPELLRLAKLGLEHSESSPVER